MDFFDEFNAFVREVKVLLKEGDYVNAALLLEDGLTRVPKIVVLPRLYISTYIKLSRYEEAKFWLSKLINKCEKSSEADALYYKGLYYFLEGKLKLSIEFLRKCFTNEIHYFKKLMYDKDFETIRESREFKRLITPTEVFEINEYITLKLIFSKTLIYICDSLFLTCQKVALSLFPSEFGKYENFNDIDDIIQYYKSSKIPQEKVTISPEEEFWAHCSNLQAWVESGYDTSILSKNLSFPILVELSKRGIKPFIMILKEELLCRIRNGGVKTLIYFITRTEENYLKYLTEEDLFNGLLSVEEAEIIRNIARLIPLEYTLTTSLLDSRRFPSVRSENKLHFCVENSHVTELELLIRSFNLSSQYLGAILKVKNLKYLKGLDIYFFEEFSNNTHDIIFWTSLQNFDELQNELIKLKFRNIES